IRVTLAAQEASRFVTDGYTLYPPALDSCFHGLIQLFAEHSQASRADFVYLPARFGEVRVYQPGTPVRSALLTVSRRSERSIQTDFVLIGERGQVVATLLDSRFRATVLDRRATFDRLTYHYAYEQIAPPVGSPEPDALSAGTLRQLAERAGIAASDTLV